MNIPMSTVSMTIKVEDYIVAETVKLNFKAELALSGEFADVDPKATVLEAVKTITDGDWYVTDSARTAGPGGIEVVNYSLNVRVKDGAISRAKANMKEANSRKGLEFSLIGLDYTPTQVQLEEANKVLRKKIYERANEELEILNGVIKSGEGEWLVGDIQFGGHPQIAKSLRTQTYAASASFMENAAAGYDGDDEGGITQRAELTASVQFTKKIYARV